MKKHITVIILLAILGIAAILRFWKLDTVPNAIANDEVIRIYNAYSIWNTGGYTVDKRFLPLSTSPEGEDLSPVSFYLSAPVTGIFGLSLFTARFSYALIGVFSVLVIFLLGKQLFNRHVGLFSAFVIAVSPWHILVTRGVWDAGVALFFYLLAILLFVRLIGSKRILWSLLVFVLALYSYHGTVIFFGILLFTLFAIHRDVLLKQRNIAVMYVVGLGLALIPLVYLSISGSLGRQSVLFWKNEKTVEEMQKRVLLERERSTGPAIAKEVFHNEYTYYIKEVSASYLNAFSANHLFIRGDITRITGYGNYLWGAMYLIELPFLIVGIYYVARFKNSRSKWIVFMALLAAPITSALILVDRTYLFRSIMMIPFLSLLTGAGLYMICKRLQFNKVFFSVFICAVGLVYLFSVAKNTYSYFYQYGVFGGEHLFKSSRDIADYVKNNKHNYSHVYVVSPEYYFLLQYAFFNQVDPNQMQNIWNDRYKTISNVTFIDWCISNEEFGDPDEKHGILYIAPENCVHDFNSVSTINDSEVPIRVLWKIYER